MKAKALPQDLLTMGERVAWVRSRLGMTQVQFAALVGLSRSETVSDWERGESKPSDEPLNRMSEASGVPVSWIVSGATGHGDAETLADRWERIAREIRRYGATPEAAKALEECARELREEEGVEPNGEPGANPVPGESLAKRADKSKQTRKRGKRGTGN